VEKSEDFDFGTQGSFLRRSGRQSTKRKSIIDDQPKPVTQDEADEIFDTVQDKMDRLNKVFATEVERATPKASAAPKRTPVAKQAIGGKGKFVNMQSDSFDVVLNILIGIKRALSNQSDLP